MTTTITATVQPTTITAEITAGGGGGGGTGTTNAPLFADGLIRSTGFDPEVGTFTEVINVGPLGDGGNRVAVNPRALLVGYTLAVIDTGERWTITASGPCTQAITPKGGQEVIIGDRAGGGMLTMIGVNGAYITDPDADATALIVDNRGAYARRTNNYVTSIVDGTNTDNAIIVDPGAAVFEGGAYDGLPIYRLAGYTPGDGGTVSVGDSSGPFINPATVIFLINQLNPALDGTWELFTDSDGDYGTAGDVYLVRTVVWNSTTDDDSTSPMYSPQGNVFLNESGGVDDGLWHTEDDGLQVNASPVHIPRIWTNHWNETEAASAGADTLGEYISGLSGGTGDVVGPASATADSLARFDGTTGKLLKNGAVIGTDVQAYDADLAAVAALSPSNDDLLQRKSGAWTNRTPAQLWSDLNTAAVTGSGTVYRTSNATAKNTDTTLATDSVLQFTGAANTDYEIRATMFVTSNATADFKTALTAPSGATFMCAVMGTGTGSSAIPGNHQQLGFLNATSDEVAAGCTTGGDGVMVEVRGIVRVSSTSGTVGIQWAQNVSTAVDTFVQSMSFLHYRKIS